MAYELDLKRFWEINEQCFVPFSTKKPRAAVSFGLDDHFLLEAMTLPSTVRYYQDRDYQLEINRQMNQITRKELSRSFYNEEPGMKLGPVRFECWLGAHWEIAENGTPWLASEVQDDSDLKKVIRHMESLTVESILPAGWKEEKEQWEKETGRKVTLGGSSRGPATIATSVLGTENLCYFLYDEPELMTRFFGLMGDLLVLYNKHLMKATGNTKTGYTIWDDNCYLYPPAQYEAFCAPVLEKLYRAFAPGKEDRRYQHSDSAMEHLMPILNDLGVNAVNLGPTIAAADIRKAMPKAEIHGQIAPFLLRNGTPEEIIASVRSDMEAVGGDGGLVFCPAGSIAGGTPFENLRCYLWAIETYGKY